MQTLIKEKRDIQGGGKASRVQTQVADTWQLDNSTCRTDVLYQLWRGLCLQGWRDTHQGEEERRRGGRARQSRAAAVRRDGGGCRHGAPRQRPAVPMAEIKMKFNPAFLISPQRLVNKAHQRPQRVFSAVSQEEQALGFIFSSSFSQEVGGGYGGGEGRATSLQRDESHV